MRAFGKVWLGIGLISIGVGICLLILAGATGFSFRNVPTFSVSESYGNDIKSLDFQINYGVVKLVEGSEFSIEGSHLYDDGGFSSEVKDGVWTIRENGNDRIEVFGFNIPVVSVFGNHFEPHITITVPRNFTAEDIRLELGAGRLEADRIIADTGSFIVDAGELEIEQLKVAEESKYNVGAGYMKLNNIEANNVAVDCGLGYINMEGSITGKNEISCGVGRVNLQLNGDPEEYSYEVDSDLGNVVVNGKDYVGSIDRSSEEELGSFDMKCGIGNITLDIH